MTVNRIKKKLTVHKKKSWDSNGERLTISRIWEKILTVSQKIQHPFEIFLAVLVVRDLEGGTRYILILKHEICAANDH